MTCDTSDAFSRKGWAEIVRTNCGPSIAVNEEGPVLESDPISIQTEISALTELNAAAFREALSVNNFEDIEEEFVKSRRAAGLRDAQIAKEYAELGASETTIELIGVKPDGTAWRLDPVTGTRTYQVFTP